ncbi:MAG: hypothetical protein KGQ66_00960 [Acidobacteriota bacterium]|nr:hypothetical protein [Acidobacteriota bacterium]
MLESVDLSSVAYGDRGYEWVTGTARFAADPEHRANQGIVDLSLAPRDGHGLVRYEADVRILRPSPGAGNGRLLVVIPNRGRLGGVPFSLDAPLQMEPAAVPEPGDGFLLESGWTVAWCGWQWDVLRGPGGLGLDAPVATPGPGRMRVEFRPDTPLDSHRLSDSSPLFRFRDYPPVEGDQADAQLSVRTTPMGPARVLERESWHFDGSDSVRLEGGFQAFHWYELLYNCAFAPVVGAGLMAVRDFAAWLGREHDRRFAYGVSQSGRFLRQFLHDGMNADENGAAVFDGVLAHIASARRGEFNQRFGQPSLTHPLSPGYGPPYDAGGLLAPSRAGGVAPKLMCTNSSWEYWRGDGALLHQDPLTGEDRPEDPDCRCYLLAGTDHFGAIPMKELFPVANPVHGLDPGPLLRALFAGLVAWVVDGVEPPASAVPRRADATAVSREEVLGTFHDAVLPDLEHLPWTPALDPRSTTWPLEWGPPAVALVSAVDQGGNETAGIRLPAVACPVQAFTGWNPRRPVESLPSVLYEFVGSRLPLQDGRRLPDRADYARQVSRWAAQLVTRRHLLERDTGRVAAEALAIYDQASG